MNLFIVPSWYPSASNPSYGIFIKEQVAMLAKERPNWNIGVSKWGQGDHEKLIWAKDHFKNIQKFNKHGLDSGRVEEYDYFKEYYQPALSWTKKFRKGNLREIIRCNELNYQAYTLEFGKPDVIMVQSCYPGIFVADYLARKYDVPIHLHVRLGGFMFKDLLNELGSMKTDMLQAISNANLITVTSNFHGKEVQKWIPNVNTLYNPVDVDFFQPTGDDSENYALAIGRLEEEKGFDLLLAAISSIDDIHIKIVGSGSQRASLLNQIDMLDLEKKASLVGETNREEVRKLIQKSQFLILPSRFETFGNVLLEAMACGKPMVATMCGGPQEIVQSEVGYLAAVDKNDLGEKIKEMQQHHSEFSVLEIRKVAESQFSPKRWIEKLEKLLKESL